MPAAKYTIREQKMIWRTHSLPLQGGLYLHGNQRGTLAQAGIAENIWRTPHGFRPVEGRTVYDYLFLTAADVNPDKYLKQLLVYTNPVPISGEQNYRLLACTSSTQGADEFIDGNSYDTGDIVTENDRIFRCLADDTFCAPNPDGWDVGQHYTPGEYVVDNGLFYGCIAGSVGDEPNPQPWIAGDYDMGDCVTDGRTAYSCTVNVSGSTAPHSDSAHWATYTPATYWTAYTPATYWSLLQAFIYATLNAVAPKFITTTPIAIPFYSLGRQVRMVQSGAYVYVADGINYLRRLLTSDMENQAVELRLSAPPGAVSAVAVVSPPGFDILPGRYEFKVTYRYYCQQNYQEAWETGDSPTVALEVGTNAVGVTLTVNTTNMPIDQWSPLKAYAKYAMVASGYTWYCSIKDVTAGTLLSDITAWKPKAQGVVLQVYAQTPQTGSTWVLVSPNNPITSTSTTVSLPVGINIQIAERGMPVQTHESLFFPQKVEYLISCNHRLIGNVGNRLYFGDMRHGELGDPNDQYAQEYITNEPLFQEEMSGDVSAREWLGGYVDFDEPITGLANLNEEIVVLTREAVYSFSPLSTDKKFGRSLIAPHAGCVNNLSIQVCEGGILVWAGKDSIYAYNGKRVIDLGEDIRDLYALKLTEPTIAWRSWASTGLHAYGLTMVRDVSPVFPCTWETLVYQFDVPGWSTLLAQPSGAVAMAQFFPKSTVGSPRRVDSVIAGDMILHLNDGTCVAPLYRMFDGGQFTTVMAHVPWTPPATWVSGTYVLGDYRLHGTPAVCYRCTTANTDATWNPAHWAAVPTLITPTPIPPWVWTRKSKALAFGGGYRSSIQEVRLYAEPVVVPGAPLNTLTMQLYGDMSTLAAATCVYPPAPATAYATPAPMMIAYRPALVVAETVEVEFIGTGGGANHDFADLTVFESAQVDFAVRGRPR